MNAHIYSKIHNIFAKSASRWYCSVFIYKCVFLPNPNTMIITYYHLSWGNSKNIVENRISICAYLDFECIIVIFMKCFCYDRYLQYIQLRHTQKPCCQKSLELTLKKLNVSTAKWVFGLWMYNSHFYEMLLLWSILTIYTIETHPKTLLPKIPRAYSKET